MHIDIRTPLGLMFGIMGLLLIALGLGGEPALHRFGINIDLWWGLAMLSFGALMLWLARR
ncbi:MAG: hypothetical protein JSS24_03385 [Proteobacteria bacterium]|nr:hypothetical protein [Pseudomonadota bacterium]